MNILGLDTCFESCSVAAGAGIGGSKARLEARFEPMATGQAERLLPMVDETMAAAGLAFADLERVAVTVGPGSFTGMRIGVAAARGLSLALGIPIVTLTSFEVMALGPSLAPHKGGGFAIAMDARRGQVYFQLFAAGAVPDSAAPRLVTINEAAALLGDGPAVFVAGSGASLVVEAMRVMGHEATAVLPGLLPDMGAALQFAAATSPAGAPPRPLYLRAPDAKPQDGKSLARAQG